MLEIHCCVTGEYERMLKAVFPNLKLLKLKTFFEM